MLQRLPAKESLTRSPGGLPPVHYTFSGGELWWSDSIFELCSLMPTKPFPNPIRQLLAGRRFKPIHGATWNTTSLTLTPGYSLHWDGTHLRGNPPPAEEPTNGYFEVWESTLDQFDPDNGPVALALSGGLDSIGLLYALNIRGVEVHAYSVDDGIADDELPRAIHYANEWAQKHVVVPTPAAQPLTAEHRSDFLDLVRCMEAPLYSFHGLAKYRLFERIRADGFDMVVSGVGADEAMVGDPRHLLGDASPWAMRQLEDTQVLQNLGVDIEQDNAPSADVVRDALLRELLPNDTLPLEVGAARAHNLRLRTPFLDDTIVRFCAAAPIEELVNNDGPEPLGKWLYRQWLDGIIPDHERLAPKRPRYIQGPPPKGASELLRSLSSKELLESIGLEAEQVMLLQSHLHKDPNPSMVRVALRLCSVLHLVKLLDS